MQLLLKSSSCAQSNFPSTQSTHTCPRLQEAFRKMEVTGRFDKLPELLSEVQHQRERRAARRPATARGNPPRARSEGGHPPLLPRAARHTARGSPATSAPLRERTQPHHLEVRFASFSSLKVFVISNFSLFLWVWETACYPVHIPRVKSCTMNGLHCCSSQTQHVAPACILA